VKHGYKSEVWNHLSLPTFSSLQSIKVPWKLELYCSILLINFFFFFFGKMHIHPINYHPIVNVLLKLPIVSMSLPKLLNNVNVPPMTKIPFIEFEKLYIYIYIINFFLKKDIFFLKTNFKRCFFGFVLYNFQFGPPLWIFIVYFFNLLFFYFLFFRIYKDIFVLLKVF
jgi:hypothetical protein